MPAGEVHLWYVCPDEVPDRAARSAAVHNRDARSAAVHNRDARSAAVILPELLSLLTEEERARRERYLFARHRHEYLVTRGLVRTVLSAYADVAPEAWRFRAGPHGKPEVAPGQQRICFNLSNTAGMVVCLVAPDTAWAVEVGVDVEDLDRAGETVAIADRFFAPAEVRDLLALPEAARRERFFEYWTLKEAYIKARGLGLLIPLDQFAFRLAPPAPPRISFAPELPDDPRGWRFAQVRLGPRHLAAAAVRVRQGCPGPLHVVLRPGAPRLRSYAHSDGPA